MGGRFGRKGLRESNGEKERRAASSKHHLTKGGERKEKGSPLASQIQADNGEKDYHKGVA